MPEVKLATPAEVYGDLFFATQEERVFADSKTFVDATPKTDPAEILSAYHARSREPDFELKIFLGDKFELPEAAPPRSAAPAQASVRGYLIGLWDRLTRTADKKGGRSSLIPLPEPYVVPGGRFREIYYWDSYFTMLGLAACGRIELMESMLANFAYLIDRIGFVPNGNRSYYCSRSQPPLFACMVELLVDATGKPDIYTQYLPQMEREYAFWMSGVENLNERCPAFRRVVAVHGGILNRYWDDESNPRQESHFEDLRLAAACDRNPGDLYRDIRAACESGWDFSSRWFKESQALTSIMTTQIIPVDLNAMLYKLETVLSLANKLAGNPERMMLYARRGKERKLLIRKHFFSESHGFFVDLALSGRHRSPLSLAAAFPLFFGLATAEQARRVAQRLQADFLKPGGYVTTLSRTGQQWDAPNGWAPLQWIVTRGLKNYGYDTEAETGAGRWVQNNLKVYRNTGRMLEKYDVERLGTFAGGGEYEVQDGFGWTNGVLLRFMDELGMTDG